MREKSFRRYLQLLSKQKTTKRLKYWRTEINEKIIGIYTNTKVRCSCNMCGNQRKYYGESIQEKRDSSKHIEME